jgi:hypothetical protein
MTSALLSVDTKHPSLLYDTGETWCVNTSEVRSNETNKTFLVANNDC